MDIGEDTWLGTICGTPVYRVSTGENIDVEQLRAHKEGRSGFYYTKVDAADVSSVRALSAEGFFVTDVNVTFAATPSAIVGNSAAEITVEQLASADKERVLDIAHDSFRFTRFHLDPLVSKATADLVKKEWIRNYADGNRGDHLFVAKAGNHPVGFLASLIVKEKATAIIDLVGVSTEAQRKGVGQTLITRFAEHYHDAKELIVGTQVANTPSIRMYETMGFRLKSSQYVLHMHCENGRVR